jgi:hypothetical protein
MKHRPDLYCVRGALTAIAALLAMAVLSPAPAQSSGHSNAQRPQSQPAQQQAPQPAQIDRNGVLILVRSTLLAVHHANQTGNYTVLRDLGAPGFQAGNTAARLGDIFANLRAQNLELSGVAVLEPQLTVLPQIVQGGMMHMAGFFPSVPLQVNFDLLFAPVEGRWRLFGIGLNLGQSSPAAPPGPRPKSPRPTHRRRHRRLRPPRNRRRPPNPHRAGQPSSRSRSNENVGRAKPNAFSATCSSHTRPE